MITRTGPSPREVENDTNPFALPSYNLAMEHAMTELPRKGGSRTVRDWIQAYNVVMVSDPQNIQQGTQAMDYLSFVSLLSGTVWRKAAG